MPGKGIGAITERPKEAGQAPAEGQPASGPMGVAS